MLEAKMKKLLFCVLFCGLIITSCATLHPVPTSYHDEIHGIGITSKTLTMTPIVQIGRSGGIYSPQVITVLETPEGHIWALLNITISSAAADKIDYDFNNILLITQAGKQLIPYLAKRSIMPTSIPSPSYNSSMKPFIWAIEKGDHEYSLYYDVDLSDTPLTIKIGESEPVELNIPPEEFKKKPFIIAS
jgi:hypothetical protein